MSGPIFGGRQAQPLDDMVSRAGGDGWEGLEELFKPHLATAPLQPSDLVAKNLAMLAQHSGSREVIEWLMDITLRQPFRPTGKTLEETALRAATRQGINGVGEAVLAAIEHGQKLLEK
ncbi:hypothetical protein H1W37_19455 [Stappia taiwanensis]|uniref:Uncharacterized protein n=1 Tax=Stappia taiwanensis TaxID=992267 RepID=A0A838Y4S1_9HYPH|nr:hypothetical protein [Stappia taiwanensis]MBA4613840.1 hypothetical protein [Stappia taiwanensis]GGE79128.1 hypothetical protein GCM10007285_03680 [Stappia taiwanensis]